jgi:hypothetical protein
MIKQLRTTGFVQMAIIAMFLFALVPGVVQADTFNVASGDAAGLIAAITAANGNGVADTINLAGGTYTLTLFDNFIEGFNGLPSITSEIIINGNDSIIERSSAGGTPEFRIFHIASGGNLRLEAVTVRNGLNSIFAGGVLNDGALSINSSTVSDNNGTFLGGGVWNRGLLDVQDSIFANNQASLGGGILSSDSLAGLTISRSTFVGNSASTVCGAIASEGSLAVHNSTFSGNSAEIDGAAICNDGVGAISNSTLSGNSAPAPGGTLVNEGELTIKNTIVGDNLAADCVGFGVSTVIVLGDNLDTDGSCLGFTQITSAQMNLDSLADNGGPTETQALLSGSLAIDMVSDCTLVDGTTPVAVDQRGVARPVGTACDVGAYETGALNTSGVGGGSVVPGS